MSKNDEVVANSVDTDQMPDLRLHSLPRPVYPNIWGKNDTEFSKKKL